MLLYIRKNTWHFSMRYVLIKNPIETIIELHCDERFKHAFTACTCVFKEITLVWVNQRNFFENANACVKRSSQRSYKFFLVQLNMYAEVECFWEDCQLYNNEVTNQEIKYYTKDVLECFCSLLSVNNSLAI